MDSFKNYLFTSEATSFICPLWAAFNFHTPCVPPNACAVERTTAKQYCCNQLDICWTSYSTCADDGSTFECGTGGWCCLKDKEICTQVPNQINVCFSKSPDILINISSDILNETYSSLSSAQPLASSYTFDPFTLIARAQGTSAETQATSAQTKMNSAQEPTSTLARTRTTSTDTVPGITSTGSSNVNSSPHHLSQGAIAGIVIAAVSVAAACVAGIFFVRYRRMKLNELEQPVTSPTDPPYDQPVQEYRKYPHDMPEGMQADTTLPVESSRI